MKKIPILLSILIVCFQPQRIFSQTTEKIISEVVRAHGGEERLDSVKNLVITGIAKSHDESSPRVTYHFIIGYPDKFRYAFQIQDTHAVFASDGKICWNVNPTFGIDQPTEMDAGEALEQKHQLDFLIPFLDRCEIQTIDNMGTFKEDNKEYFVLKVEYKDGFFAEYFIDKESFLIAKRRQIHRHDGGGETELVYSLSDYRDVIGVKFPFEFRSSLSSLIYTIDSYEINAENLDDSLFEMEKK